MRTSRNNTRNRNTLVTDEYPAFLLLLSPISDRLTRHFGLFKSEVKGYHEPMTIDCKISEKMFRDFTLFDILRRRKQWKSPVIFSAILTLSAVICFIMHSTDGAVLLGCVLLTVALGMPAVYFLTFFSSLKKQVRLQNLDPPRTVYTVNLTDAADGIRISNGRESANYRWDRAYHAYLTDECIYLYMTAERAFIIPVTDRAAVKLVRRNMQGRVTQNNTTQKKR